MMERLLKKALVVGLLIHFAAAFTPLVAEVRLMLRELPLLWGKTNEQRRSLMHWGGMASSEDSEFRARCQEEIPPDADVLIVTDSLTKVFILNYYLYPRKTGVDELLLGDHYWTVYYFPPKPLGPNRIEKPQQNGSSD